MPKIGRHTGPSHDGQTVEQAPTRVVGGDLELLGTNADLKIGGALTVGGAVTAAGDITVAGTVNLPGGTARPIKEPDPRSDSTSGWTEVELSTNDANCPATALTFEHGKVVLRGSGAGTTTRSNRRSGFLIPNSPGGYSRIRSRWSGPSYASGSVPQRGHMHGLGTQSDGMIRAVVIWHDIVFSAPWVFNIGIWEADPDDLVSGFSPNSASVADQVAVSAGSRSSNVVTLTVPSGHGIVAGDVITVDVTDSSYDGTFSVTSVTSTTVVYGQTAADDASAGTGTIDLPRQSLTKAGLLKQVTASDASRTNGLVTATVSAGHPFQVADHIGVDMTDATYDGNFAVTATTGTSVSWRQAVSDDASAGSGTLTKVLPYWVESEWTEGRARFRVWPDVVGLPDGSVAPAGPPSWESPWATSAELSTSAATEPDPDLGTGCYLMAGHLFSDGTTASEIAYDSVTVEGLS